jgi:hypothetical protein
MEQLVSPLGELLSVACPTESNQRRGHPTITAFGFLALLNKVSGHETRPDSLHTSQAAAELKQSFPYFLLCFRYSA